MAKMRMIKIDGKKLKEQLKAQGFTLEAASLRMGRSAGYLKQIAAKGELPTHTMRHITNEYNIKIEDIQPDPQPEPEPKQMQLKEESTAPAATEAVSLETAERYLKQMDQHLAVLQEAAEAIQLGFRVQVRSSVDGETIAQAVKDGMCRWWAEKWPDMGRQLRGMVYSAQLEAMKAWSQLRDDEIRRRQNQ